MIGWLEGKVRHRNAATGIVVLQTGGVGYEVNVSMQTLASIPEEGQTVALFVHTHVREDQITLYGFADAGERTLYRMLTSVPKVGPRNAIAVLGGFPIAELVRCIDQGQHGMLVKIPGIGKKTAEQIILTLGDKMAPLLMGLADLDECDAPAERPENAQFEAARDVLLSMGWKPRAVEKALDALDEDASHGSLDDVVRALLALLMEQ